jgi:hypothetical protein
VDVTYRLPFHIIQIAVAVVGKQYKLFVALFYIHIALHSLKIAVAVVGPCHEWLPRKGQAIIKLFYTFIFGLEKRL